MAVAVSGGRSPLGAAEISDLAAQVREDWSKPHCSAEAYRWEVVECYWENGDDYAKAVLSADRTGEGKRCWDLHARLSSGGTRTAASRASRRAAKIGAGRRIWRDSPGVLAGVGM